LPNRYRLSIASWLLAAGLLLCPVAALASPAQDPAGSAAPARLPQLTVTFLEDRPADFKLDGKLTEPVWATLPVHRDLQVIEPDTLAAPAHETRVRLFYTKRGLYVSFDMDQPADTLIARLSGRDGSGINRDTINITLDTSGDGRYAFWFGLGLGGAISDGTVLPERRFQNEWDGPWRGASSVTERGWSAEVFIPWGIVAMPRESNNRRMGFYISRSVAYLAERWAWPALPSTQSRFLSVLQPLNFETLKPRQQLDFYPFTAVTSDYLDDDVRFQSGLDLFWRPSTNFQLSATLNPDFGGVESDNADLNLTAQETFFPEKRLFFQEGQQVFIATPRADNRSRGIGNPGPPFTMVNTRRIGGLPRAPDNPLDATIEPQDLRQFAQLSGALKATGQIGALRYGLLGATEEESKFDATIPAGELHLRSEGSNYGILRLLYEDAEGGGYRGLGLLSTTVVNEARDASAHGIDWHYLSNTGRFRMDGQSFVSDIEGTATGYGGFVDFELIPRQGRFYRLGIEHFDRHIDLNDLGFLQRNDRNRIRMSHGRQNSNISFGRNNDFDVRGFVSRNNDGLFLGGGIFFTNRVTFNDLSRLTLNLNQWTGGYDDLNSFGNGSFWIEPRTDFGFTWETPSNRRLIVGLGFTRREENLNEDSNYYRLSLTWRPSDAMVASLNLAYDDRSGWLLHQEDQNFTTFDAEQWRPSLTFEYFASARQQFRVSWQWIGVKAREQKFYRLPRSAAKLSRTAKPAGPSDDFAISDMIFQARYRLELAPLSDLFVVYTRISDTSRRLGQQSFDDLASDGWNQPFANQLVVKLRYRFGT
jgi:hypothetical protein